MKAAMHFDSKMLIYPPVLSAIASQLWSSEDFTNLKYGLETIALGGWRSIRWVRLTTDVKKASSIMLTGLGEWLDSVLAFESIVLSSILAEVGDFFRARKQAMTSRNFSM